MNWPLGEVGTAILIGGLTFIFLDSLIESARWFLRRRKPRIGSLPRRKPQNIPDLPEWLNDES